MIFLRYDLPLNTSLPVASCEGLQSCTLNDSRNDGFSDSFVGSESVVVVPDHSSSTFSMLDFFSTSDFRDKVIERQLLEQRIRNELVDRIMLSHYQGRKAVRYAYSMLADCVKLDPSLQVQGEYFSVIGQDLSTTGIGVRCSCTLPIGSMLAFNLPTRGSEQLITVGQVVGSVRRDTSSYGLGIRFTTHDERSEY